MTEPLNFTELAKLPTPNAQELLERAQSALRMVDSYQVVDVASFALANEELRAIKAKLEALDWARRKITDPLGVAVKAVNDLFRAPRETLEVAESTIKNKLVSFTRAEEVKAKAAAAAAEALAQAERTRLAAEAAAAEAKGHAGQAEAIRSMAAVVRAAPVRADPIKAAGFSVRKRKILVITDASAFLAHIAASKLVNLVSIDTAATLHYMTALGLAELPGVKVDEIDVAASRK